MRNALSGLPAPDIVIDEYPSDVAKFGELYPSVFKRCYSATSPPISCPFPGDQFNQVLQLVPMPSLLG